MITQEALKAELSYNPETGLFQWLKQRPRRDLSRHPGSKINGYWYICLFGKQYSAATLAVLYMTGVRLEKGLEVDHKNRNKTDNRWDNLAVVTRAENIANTRGHNDASVKLKGVSFRPDRNKYEAQIMRNGIRQHLGLFATSQEAAEAYQKAAT